MLHGLTEIDMKRSVSVISLRERERERASAYCIILLTDRDHYNNKLHVPRSAYTVIIGKATFASGNSLESS